jgi:hypothetical protein
LAYRENFFAFDVRQGITHVEDKTSNISDRNLNNNKICKIYKFRIQETHKKIFNGDKKDLQIARKKFFGSRRRRKVEERNFLIE